MNESVPLLRRRLQLGEAEITLRRDLHGLTDDVLELLKTYRGLVTEEVDGVVRAFYEHQVALPEVVGVIGDEVVLDRLRGFLRRYILQLFDGRCDLVYIDNRLAIGQRHEQIGIAPKLYLAAVRKLRELIDAVLDRRLAPAAAAGARRAVDRLLTFDATLVIDTYIDGLMHEVETARRQLQEHAGNLERTVARRTAQLEELARRDPLTDLYNPRALRELLERELSGARRAGRPLSLAYFDVDNFKQINDTHGHQTGDEVLECVGRVLRATCREVDIPCRYGGDEFCIVVVDGDLDHAEVLCRRVIEAFDSECPGVTFSIGLAQTGPASHGSLDELFAAADRKMYEAKKEPGFQIRR